MVHYPVWTREMAQQERDRICAQLRQPRPLQVSLSTLPPAQKRRAWEYLKVQHPGVVELLQDATLQQLRQTFDADVYISKELLRELLDEPD